MAQGTRNMDVIHSGWLVKSPPEKKIQGQWFGKIFQAKWRRRFFVLHVPPASASLPGSYDLAYYDNANLRKKLGSIDLDQCEQIIATLDSAHYKHLFALRTKHKGRDRTYYLAADTDQDMNKWVECLCKVCGFKPDPPEEGRLPTTDASWPTQQAPQPQSFTTQHSQPIRNSPINSRTQTVRNSPILGRNASSTSSISRSEASSTPETPVRKTSVGESYIHLGTCFSDSKKSPMDRQSTRKTSGSSPLDQVPPPPKLHKHGGSRDSIPDMPAPPPPLKTGLPMYPDTDPNQTYDQPSKSYVNIDAVNPLDDDTYKVPPRRQYNPESCEEEGLYKVPPSRHLEFVPGPEEWYQVPPSRGGDLTHNYNNLPTTNSLEREFEYDVPPAAKSIPNRSNSQRDSNSSSGSRGSQKQDSAYGSEDPFYSVPPARKHNDTQSMELLTDQMRTSTLNSKNGDDTYDVPPRTQMTRKAHSETNILDFQPPPPRPPKGGEGNMASTQGPYMNLPPNSKSHPLDSNARAVQNVESLYDHPPKKPSDMAMLNMSPPPPQPCAGVKVPRYVNAPPGYNPNGAADNMYLPMKGGAMHGQGISDEMYVSMGMGTRDSLYTDMSGIHGIYTAPPSNQPINRSASYSAKPGTVPPKLQKLSSPTEEVMAKKEDTYVIYSTNRTRSFKRTISPEGDIKLPVKRSTLEQDPSSSDDDDSDSMDSHEPSIDNLHLKAAQSAEPQPNKKNLNSTPPPPPRSGEVQYLDLDLDDNSDTEKSPVFPRSPPVPGNVSPTDYKEIDFVKTHALTDLRKGLESKRKSSEKSVDE